MNSVERKLPITVEQVQLLQELERGTQEAIGRMNVALAAMLAAHGIRGGTFKGLEPGDPPQLVVEVAGPALVGTNGEQPVNAPEAPAS